MNRLFLALLALLTGLAAQVTPAQARMSSGGEIELGSYEQVRSNKPATGATAAAETPAIRQERREREAQRQRSVMRPRVFIPSVLFGADRAFE
jgi:hypothetical protein